MQTLSRNNNREFLIGSSILDLCRYFNSVLFGTVKVRYVRYKFRWGSIVVNIGHRQIALLDSFFFENYDFLNHLAEENKLRILFFKNQR